MKIGILGVGHMAGFLVKGWRSQGFTGPILLGPRNRDTAAQLAKAWDCQVLESNQAVVDAADAVILTVPAKLAKPVLEELSFRDDQLVVSACAGQGQAFLQEVATPARLIISLPVAAAAIGRSPTLLYPDDAEAKALFEPLGPVLVMKDEKTFMAASVNSASCGWVIDLIRELALCNVEAGVEPAEARRLVSLMVESTAAVVLSVPDQPLPKIVEGLASKGGLTECGLKVLQSHDANAPWREAFESVLARVK